MDLEIILWIAGGASALALIYIAIMHMLSRIEKGIDRVSTKQ